jgi:hypothetical protein
MLQAKHEIEHSIQFPDILQTSGSQPLWDRGPITSFFIRRGPGIIDARARRLKYTVLDCPKCQAKCDIFSVSYIVLVFNKMHDLLAAMR